ncbi:integrase [Halobacteriales archaeon QH_7_65_31]|nr:MAG: integrase [Halobacteriales archaeon QH_7_65_31]
MSRDRTRDPGAMGMYGAIERYLRQREVDSESSSLSTWRYQLKLFAEWTEKIGIEQVGELRGYDIDDWYSMRASEVAPSTLEGEMWTLKMFVKFLERREAVSDGLADKVQIPDVDAEDRSSDEQWPTAEALTMLRYHRTTPESYATREHALLELQWTTGARLGGIRALDLRDVFIDDGYVHFRDRPDTGTGLKNDRAGERPVALPPSTATVLHDWLQNRPDMHDEYGRAPFLPSQRGRPTENTIRMWTYVATLPCKHSPCPHGNERTTCDFTTSKTASKCPSSRSPHPIRTGSISWQLDIGLPPWVVAERVNAGVDVIEEHYDKTPPRERMERRRRPFITDLEADLEDPNT